MKSIFKRFHLGQQGFTLIELLVVIAILGILAAVAIPNLASFMNSGKSQAAATELSIVQTAVVAYMLTHDGDIPDMGSFTGATGTGGDIAEYLTSSLGYGPYTVDGTGKVSGP